MSPSALRNRDELIAHIAEDNKVEYLFFWGHTATNNNKTGVGKECLSQWYPAGFDNDGIHYPTAEHYMMAEKARLFNDKQALEKILVANDPNDAKELGRTVKGYQEALWKKHRVDIVVRGNQAKFSQNEKLKTFLKTTGDKVLVEASPHDKIWGIGLEQSHPDASNPAKWRGLNLLGFGLMKVRSHSL